MTCPSSTAGHPRSRKRLEASGFQLDSRVIRHEPLGFHDYNCLQMNAFAVVSDSGYPAGGEFLLPVCGAILSLLYVSVQARSVPRHWTKGCFVLAGIDEKSLLQAVDTAVELNRRGDYGVPVPDYVDENVSTKVVRLDTEATREW